MQPNYSIRKISQCTYPVQGIMQARHTSISPMPSKRNNKQQSTKSCPANSHVRLTNISDTGSVSIIRVPIWLLGIQSYQEADNGLLEPPDTAGSPRLTEFCHYKPSRDTQILLLTLPEFLNCISHLLFWKKKKKNIWEGTSCSRNIEVWSEYLTVDVVQKPTIITVCLLRSMRWIFTRNSGTSYIRTIMPSSKWFRLIKYKFLNSVGAAFYVLSVTICFRKLKCIQT
jgi:hypothetical protein